MCEYEIRYLILDNGRKPFEEWFKNLDASMRKRTSQRLMRIQQGNFGDFKKIDSELSEFRLKFGRGYRIYFMQQENNIIILLTGGDKSAQTADIEKAKGYIKILKGINDEKY